MLCPKLKEEAQGQIGTLLGILGSPSRPGELFKLFIRKTERSRKTAKEKEKANYQFVFDSRTVLAPVDAAFEEFFAFPKGQTFGEILQSKDARSRFAALSLQLPRVQALVQGHFLRDLVTDPDAAAAAGRTFPASDSHVSFKREPNSGDLLVQDACGTTSRVLAGPMPWKDPAWGDTKALYLLDELLVPKALCSYGF